MSHICEQNHHIKTIDELQELPNSQKNEVRHVCAACAYEKGYKDGVAAARGALVKALGDMLSRALPPWLR